MCKYLVDLPTELFFLLSNKMVPKLRAIQYLIIKIKLL